MSHEHPGDGKRCDYCDRTPRQVPETPQWLLDSPYGKGFMHNQGSVLCYVCFTTEVDGELAAFVAANKAITPRVKNGRGSLDVVGLSVSNNARWINGQRVHNYAPIEDR